MDTVRHGPVLHNEHYVKKNLLQRKDFLPLEALRESWAAVADVAPYRLPLVLSVTERDLWSARICGRGPASSCREQIAS